MRGNALPLNAHLTLRPYKRKHLRNGKTATTGMKTEGKHLAFFLMCAGMSPGISPIHSRQPPHGSLRPATRFLVHNSISQRPCLSFLVMEVATRTRYEHMHLLHGVLRRANLTQQPMHRSRSALPRDDSGAACRPEMNLAQPRWLQHAHTVCRWCMLAPCSYLELGDNSMH